MDLRETQFNPQHLPSRDKFAFCLLEHQNPLTFSSTALLLTPISPLSSHISYFFLSALKGFLFFLFSSWASSLWHEVFSGGSAGKEFACNEEDLGSVPGLGRSPGGENDYPLQYSGMENSMDCIVHGVAKSRTWLSDFEREECRDICRHTLSRHSHSFPATLAHRWPVSRVFLAPKAEIFQSRDHILVTVITLEPSTVPGM